MKQNTSVLGKLILSLAYRYSLATLYASTLRSTDRRNASPPRPQNHPHVYHPHGMSLSRIYTMRFLYYYEFDLATMVGSTPSNVFVTRPKPYAHCVSAYTRDLDAAGYDFPRDWHWLVTSKPIVIPYHLPTCRSFSPVYIHLLHFGLGHHLMKSTITTSAPSPYTTHSTSPRLFSPSLSPDRPFSVRVDCVPIYIRISRFSTFHTPRYNAHIDFSPIMSSPQQCYSYLFAPVFIVWRCSRRV